MSAAGSGERPQRNFRDSLSRRSGTGRVIPKPAPGDLRFNINTGRMVKVLEVGAGGVIVQTLEGRNQKPRRVRMSNLTDPRMYRLPDDKPPRHR